MIKEVTATGTTVDQALAAARAMLNAPYDAEVHTEILEMPKKKVLGLFGGAPAKARAWWDMPEEKKAKAAPAKAEKKTQSAKTAEKKKPAEKKIEKAAPAAMQEDTADEKKKIDINSNPVLSTAAEYLKTIVLGMGCEKAEIEAFEAADNEVVLELNCGDDYGIIIGRRGETLDSIQYLTRLAANKNKTDSEYSRISVNVGNYREKRKQTLADLARKNAAKVLKYGRNFAFEPMNPYERRIIHTTVQEIEGVTSHSVGSDSERRVVITLADGVRPTHPSKGGYNGRGRSGRRPNNSRKPSANKPSAPAAPKREPKTDAGAQGISLYGKIN